MRYKTHTSSGSPRLVIERSKESPEQETGFVHINNSIERIEVGNVDGWEFRLLQCLFSPNNFLTAKYEPVIQTYERAFSAIQRSVSALVKDLPLTNKAENNMITVVEKSLKTLQSSAVGQHFSFVFGEGRVHMAVKAL